LKPGPRLPWPETVPVRWPGSLADDSLDDLRQSSLSIYAAVHRDYRPDRHSVLPDWVRTPTDLLESPPGVVLIGAEDELDPYAPELARFLELNKVRVTRSRSACARAAGGTQDGEILVDARDRLRRGGSDVAAGALTLHQASSLFRFDSLLDIWQDTIPNTVRLYDELCSVEERLADDESKFTLLAIIADQLTGLPYFIKSRCAGYRNHYFGTGLFSPTGDDVVVDCGAFEGDTLETFAQWSSDRFDRYFALEPDPANFLKLCECETARRDRGTTRPRIECLNKGVWHESTTISFLSGRETQSRVEAASDGGNSTVECVAIDDAFGDHAVSLIKADVEGAELEMLRGARRTIAKHRPKLLISAYHRTSHLFEIPRLIDEINGDYEIYLRNHTWAGEVPTEWRPGTFFTETVVYAV
jgi:FkbM family methyltransferase